MSCRCGDCSECKRGYAENIVYQPAKSIFRSLALLAMGKPGAAVSELASGTVKTIGAAGGGFRDKDD